MKLGSATIIAAVCDPDNLIGYKTNLVDRKGYEKYILPSNCQIDKDFFINTVRGQFCVLSSITARGMSKSYLDHFPISEHIFPFWATSTLYTASKRYKREVNDVINLAIKDAENHPGDKKVFVCGGSQIYEEALKNDNVNEMILTCIPSKFKVDIPSDLEKHYSPIYFPEVDWSEWREQKTKDLGEGVLVKRYRRK